MSLEELRKKIDEVDAEIISLLGRRIELAGKIGKEKASRSLPVYAPQREEEVLKRVAEIARSYNISPEVARRVYGEILKASRAVQGLVVAFQGELGAYSEEAAYQFFSPAIKPLPCEKLEDVFDSVTQGQSNYGIIPVENSLEGSISKSYDLLLESDLVVSGEVELRISHCLIANPGASLDSIKKVYSHPQALGQCQTFLKHLGAELVPTYDTAGSVKMVREMGITAVAAIASRHAAEMYGLNILRAEIEDSPNNYTRFFIIGREYSPPTGKDKTSVVFSVKHRPGSLASFLDELAGRGINLTKIESRPTRQKPWEYNFYLDFEGHLKDDIVREALKKAEEQTIFFKVLGSYPKARK